jgi:hypothetical protein
MKRHSADEIAAKLRQAEEFMARGQSQAQACRALGVSVMTFHRWRKSQHERLPNEIRPSDGTGVHRETEVPEPESTASDQRRIEELRLENDRLRRIVTDLLLEKLKTEEQLAQQGDKKANRQR